MASSGSMTTTAASGRSLTFNWWVNSTDIAGNWKNIGWNLVGSGSSSPSWVTSGNFRVDAAGATRYSSSTRINVYVGTVIASGSFYVYGDSAGNASFSAYVEAGINTVAVNCYGSGSWALDRIPRNPRAPQNMAHARVSDNRNDLSWGYASTSDPWGGVYVERSVNGGAFAHIATVSLAGVTSYSDTTTQPNHSYAYRVRTEYYGTWSAYSTSGITYNTPGTPGKPSPSRVDATTVRLDFTNGGLTQTATEISRSTDAKTWSTVATVDGSSVTTTTNAPGGGTFYYRVRNTRGALASDWSPTSDAVVTIAPPAAPTLLAPISGGVVKKSDTSIAFSWLHNPIDGATQTSAELRYSTNGGSTWATQAVSGAAQAYTLTNGFAVNASVVWQVRTKGAHTDFGAWSSSGNFKVCQVPQASIKLPTSPLKSMPMTVSWDYSDQSGTQTAAAVTLLTDTGAQAYRENLSSSATTLQITSVEFLPENGKTYTLRIEARSSSGLTATTEIPFFVDYIPPAIPIGRVDIDDDRGAVSLLVLAGEDNTGLLPVTTAVGAYRRHTDGRTISLVDQAQSGSGCQDLYPPLDQDFEYVFVACTSTGVTSQLVIPINIPSCGCVFFNFGESFSSVAKVALDTGHTAILKHQTETYQTAGNPWPLVFYGAPDTMTGSVSGVALRKVPGIPICTIEDIKTLSTWRGYVIMRMPYEAPIPVAIDVSNTYTRGGLESQIAVAWQRVRGRNGLVL